MRILIALGHPNPKSFNHAIATAVRDALIADGHDVVFRDLHAEGFDPVITAQEMPEGGPVPAAIHSYCDELRAADVINTSNTPQEREMEGFGDPLEALWKRCIFDLCGVREFHRRVFGVVVTSAPEQRRAWLDEAAELCGRVFRGDSRD